MVTAGIVAPDNLVGVDYPAQLWPSEGTVRLDESVRVGTDNLDLAIHQAAGPVTVVGISQGAIGVNYEKRRLIAESGPPAASSATIVGDPTDG